MHGHNNTWEKVLPLKVKFGCAKGYLGILLKKETCMTRQAYREFKDQHKRIRSVEKMVKFGCPRSYLSTCQEILKKSKNKPIAIPPFVFFGFSRVWPFENSDLWKFNLSWLKSMLSSEFQHHHLYLVYTYHGTVSQISFSKSFDISENLAPR